MAPNEILESVNIPQFDINSLMPDATILILGKRRSGKSILLKDIFYHHKQISSGVVFSGTETANPFFSEFIPDSFIYNKYDANIINKLINRQKIKVNAARERRLGVDGKTKDNNIFIVLDDMQAESETWKNDETIKNIFFNGRHYNIFFMLSLQYSMGITAALRGNIDYVFVFNEPSYKNKKKIYEDYGSIIPSFDQWCNIMDKCTEDFGCLVIKTSGASSVSWYKAKIHSPFKVSKNIMWEYHRKHYNNNHTNETILKESELIKMKDKYKNSRRLKVIVSKESGEMLNIIK
jgi:hypothetical protein